MPKFDVYIPENVDDALAYLAEHENDALPIASGTDLLPRIRRRKVVAKNVLDLSGLTELRYIKQDAGRIRIGALTTVAELEAQDGDSAWCRLLRQAAEKFGSPNIRSVATVGGNICAASSSEDLIPIFLVLDANVKIIGRKGTRELPLQDFLVAKRKTALNPDEVVAEVSFAEPGDNAACSFQKLGMRNILIIALVTVAVFLETDEKGSKIKSARVALNRLAGKIPARANRVEDQLLGKGLDEQTMQRAVDALGEQLTLTSDFRASGEYRCEAVKILLRRALAECQNQILKK